jgi:hypothetical protein
MIAITTSSSIKVKPRARRIEDRIDVEGSCFEDRRKTEESMRKQNPAQRTTTALAADVARRGRTSIHQNRKI